MVPRRYVHVREPSGPVGTVTRARDHRRGRTLGQVGQNPDITCTWFDGLTAPDLSTPNSRRSRQERSSSLEFGLVVPVHPPKMSELCNLVHSNVPFSIPLWAVLSRREHASLLRCHVDWFVIPEFVGNLSQAERSHKNTNIPTKKKCWMAIKYVFDNFPSMPTLVALDAESTVLRPLAMRDVHEFEIDMAIVTYGVQPATRLFREINAISCRAVHLPPIRHAAYMWWGEAPIYLRQDFDDFYQRVDWGALRNQHNRVLDHISYLCYQYHVHGWRLVHANSWLERPHCLTHVEHHRLIWRPHQPTPCARGEPWACVPR